MAASPQVQGILREYWHEAAHQVPGDQWVYTNIAISQELLSRVQGFLAISVTAGTPTFSALAAVVDKAHAPAAKGWLAVRVRNEGGGAADWDLDVALVTSPNQGRQHNVAGRIMVTNGTQGLLGPQTLAATYIVGAGAYPAADQTMVITDAHGGGVIVDASNAGDPTMASVCALEVRQNNADISVPFLLSRRGDFANPAQLVFQKGRGTFGAQDNVQADDMMGCIDWFARVNGAMSPAPGAQIIGVVLSVAGNVLDGALDFYASLDNVSTPVMRIDVPVLGRVGVLGNIAMGGGAIGGGAKYTVMLPNATGGAVMPVAQADQIYLGALDWGQGLAALAIASEEPVAPSDDLTIDTVIPIVFNGVPYYLFAKDMAPT